MLNATDDKKLMTVHKIWKSKKIYWINTYKTLLKYVSTDYTDIFKPIIKTGKGKSGKRYYVSEKNLNEFVRKFENNELSN